MTTINRIHAREILDSRGNPTVEADVILASGSRVKSHKTYVLGAHDEYYSAAMRTALEHAGAQRGLLIASREGVLHLEAQAVTSGNDTIGGTIAGTSADAIGLAEALMSLPGSRWLSSPKVSVSRASSASNAGSPRTSK